MRVNCAIWNLNYSCYFISHANNVPMIRYGFGQDLYDYYQNCRRLFNGGAELNNVFTNMQFFIHGDLIAATISIPNMISYLL